MTENILADVKAYIEGGNLEQSTDAFLLLLINFVIEKYKKRRNYPSYFDLIKINKDIEECRYTIMMAAIDIYAKVGGEGQVTHNENGINRTFENAYISLNVFCDVISFCDLF